MFLSINIKRALVTKPALDEVMEAELKPNTHSPPLMVLMDYWEEDNGNQIIVETYSQGRVLRERLLKEMTTKLTVIT